ncbi:hypothetical protein [Flavobacterium panacagri]|uniref:hypothetical protein n=1 Tax=Flavobacterium panacagri TaxID=3034146 RepID=UPI0025A54304|nr:hypothetical protein [Flavobacterium panacagri]
MNKKQWQDLYNILDGILSDFLFTYPTYKNGKNKKIRGDAERKVDNTIALADYHVRNNWEVYELLTGGSDVNDFGRSIIYEEFRRPNYFGGDLSKLLTKIKEKINSF